MRFNNLIMVFALPVFTGVLGSLFLSSQFALHGIGVVDNVAFSVQREISAKEAALEPARLFTEDAEKITDSILEQYRSLEYRDWVIDFFTGICANREIAESILSYADRFEVSPALAFALGWEESRFNPNAVNRKNHNGSTDRGLFQLNDLSFPYLETESFFNIRENARYGVGHLRHCLDRAGFEIAALAMYNAGENRIRTMGTPKATLDYVSRILENRVKIETNFKADLEQEEELRLTDINRRQAVNKKIAVVKVWSYLNRTFISASPL